MSAHSAACILKLSSMHISACIVRVSCFDGGLFHMLNVQQQYFLHAHSSMYVNVLAVASLSTCSATEALA